MSEQSPLPWSVFDNLPEPVLVLDGKRAILAANRAAKTVLGTVVEGGDLVLALRHPAALAAADAALAGVVPVPVEISVTGGTSRIFEVRAAPVPADGGNRAVLTLHDTTREHRAQGMRADFVANVSHELRSPLAALLGFVETLRGPAKDDPDAQGRFLSIMQSEAERMARLIDDLLSLSKVEADEHIAPRDPVAMLPLLRRVADVSRARADQRGVTVSIVAPESVPAVAGDGDQLTQVFQNLVDNAIKYGHADSEVVIDVSTVERMPGGRTAGVVVRVIDHGDGIPEEELPRLTERFYRIDKARSRSLGGTGLGLAIVKHIVGRHRGRLAIDSAPGVGSTFSVTLPVHVSQD